MSEAHPDLRDALPVGTVVGDYELEALLGHGGFGVVYRAHHVELGQVVALKEYLPPDLAVRTGGTVYPRSTECTPDYEDGRRRFLEEAKRIVQFKDDPGVVACLGYFRANGTAYIVLEHVDGMSLAELLRRREGAGRPLDRSELRFLVLPLLETVSRLHKADVLHRDIKPSNILLRRADGKPVLIDFGAAKQQATLHSKSAAPFTEGYAAMEQMGDGELGPWTDVYALGAVMWRIVAGGKPPWQPPNPKPVALRASALLAGRPDPLPTASDLGSGRFPQRVLSEIDRALTVSDHKRPNDLEDLRNAVAGEGRPGGASGLPQIFAYDEAGRWWQRQAAVLVAVGAVAAILTGMWISDGLGSNTQTASQPLPTAPVVPAPADPPELEARAPTQPVANPAPPPAKKRSPPKRLRVSGDIIKTRLAHQVKPQYPPLARQARIQGTVKLSAVIAKDGSIQSTEVMSGHPLLVPAALAAVRQWRYEPTEAVEVLTTIDVNFALSEAATPPSSVISSAPAELPPPAVVPPPPVAKKQGPSRRIRVGGNVAKARLIHKVRPQHPPLARRTRVQGTVKLSAVIAKDGSIQALEVMSGNPLLVPAAVAAVRQWRYKPTLLNGEAVEVLTSIDVNFALSSGGTSSALTESPPPPVVPPPPVKTQSHTKRLRVGGNIAKARLVRRVRPQYPIQARQARVQGTVKLSAVIATDGSVQTVDVVSGHPLLVSAAVAAVKQWRYKPTLLNGEAVEVLTSIDVNFKLGG